MIRTRRGGSYSREAYRCQSKCHARPCHGVLLGTDLRPGAPAASTTSTALAGGHEVKQAGFLIAEATFGSDVLKIVRRRVLSELALERRRVWQTTDRESAGFP